MNARIVSTLAILVAAFVVVVIFFMGDSAAPVVTAVPTNQILATPAPATATVEPPAEKSPTTPAAAITRPAPAPSPMAAWELKIDECLRLNPDNTEAANLQTAQLLINYLPTFPPEGQATAAQHISNLLPDKEYNRVLPFLKNPGAPQELLDVLMTDLMNRTDSVKLPALLDVAKLSNHPHHEEAVTDLQIFLDGDYGTDWAKWDSAMKDYLAKQKAEASAVEPAK